MGAALRAIPRAVRQANAVVARRMAAARSPEARWQVKGLLTGEAAGRAEMDAATGMTIEIACWTGCVRMRRMTSGAAREAACVTAQGAGVSFAGEIR